MELYNGRPEDTSGRKEKEIKVYDILDSLHIPYIRADHEAVMTMEACEEIDKALGMEICKNLFLCNRKKTSYYLLLMPGNKALKTKELSQQIPTTRLSFASGEDMETYLNVTPGSATVMGLIFDPENKVQLLVDEELLEQEEFGCHPCVNTSSIKMKTADVFDKFLKEIHHDYITVKLSDGNEQEVIKMDKQELALVVIDRLKKEYPDAGCTLDYDDAWKLLVSVRLAAQCTDARVNVVVEGLYAKYPDVNALAEATPEEIEEIVRPCGLGKSKARDISACMRMLRDEYDGKVPDDFNKLLKLPGVGRKSANLIMGDVFGKPAIVTDTHCIRLCNRIGLVDEIKEPKKVEMELWKIIPPEEGSDFCHRLVYHGRDVCTARTKPHCEKCCLADICGKHI